jgi:hypothetical protein
VRHEDCLTQSQKGIVTFGTSYRLSYTGRLNERYGFQGLTRINKSLVHGDRFNYDISSSQLRVLLIYLDKIYECFKDTLSESELYSYNSLRIIEEYINNSDAKKYYAKQAGVSVDDWKKCLYALVFGGKISEYHSAIGEIIQHNEIFNSNFRKEILLVNLQRFKLPIQLLYSKIVEYSKTTKLSVVEKSSLKRSINLIEYNNETELDNFIYNGVNFIDKDSELANNSTSLVAYYLQGTESAFIYHLIDLVADSNIIFSYEFDGLVVNMEIPEEIIQLARERSGFLTAVVVHKPFL